MPNNYILTSDGNFISKDELYHHSVKGMKWGVHRYQRSDGSLTPAGRKRAEKDAKRIANMQAKYNDRAVSQEKVKKTINKVKARWENTRLSDMTIEESVYNGRKYTAVLMGRVCDSPYDGSARYLVTAGTWSKTRDRD